MKLEDILEMDATTYFDVFIRFILFNRSFLHRVVFTNQNIGISVFDKKNHYLLESYPTTYGNLSFSFLNFPFDPTVESFEKREKGIQLKGQIELGDEIEFDTLQILAYSRGYRKIFPCEYERKGSNVKFKCDVDVDFEPEDVDTDWHFRIRLIDNELLIRGPVLKAYHLSNFESHSSYLLEKVDCGEVEGNEVCLFFFANPKKEFKLQILTEQKYQSRVQTAQNKDWYDQYKKDPIDNKIIFFESFHGKYNNNPKYIYEKMLELGFDKKYTLVWSYDGDEDIPGNPVIVRTDEEDYFKYLAHAKYRVNNTTFPIIDLRNEITYLQTWHGTPLKRVGSDIKVKNSSVSWTHFNQEVPSWNYLVSANEYSSDTFKRAFSFKKDMLEEGYPANDVFYTKGSEFISKIKSSLGLPEDKKIILYAPTFRDDKIDENGNRSFDLELDLEYLYSHLKDDYVLVIKTHSAVSESLELDNTMDDFVHDCSNHDDIHELFIISDILITDYSSVFFDYAHSRRPILFFTPDFDSYIVSRGLYFEVVEELPGPQLINNEEIVESILNIDSVSEEYKDKYDHFYEKYCSIGHGDASQKIIDIVFKEN